ncbi:hypothetical protein E4T45_02712 [Aureobasidium sp. EXF-8846]|nr:hypothetical protein E4T45_02712 [Aureobasidium sp. EXF-8846]
MSLQTALLHTLLPLSSILRIPGVILRVSGGLNQHGYLAQRQGVRSSGKTTQIAHFQLDLNTRSKLLTSVISPHFLTLIMMLLGLLMTNTNSDVNVLETALFLRPLLWSSGLAMLLRRHSRSFKRWHLMCLLSLRCQMNQKAVDGETTSITAITEDHCDETMLEKLVTTGPCCLSDL